jgi:hypothetical protein
MRMARHMPRQTPKQSAFPQTPSFSVGIPSAGIAPEKCVECKMGRIETIIDNIRFCKTITPIEKLKGIFMKFENTQLRTVELNAGINFTDLALYKIVYFYPFG